MAVTILAGTGVRNSGSDLSPVPPTHVTGDLLLAFISSGSGSVSSATSGWNSVTSQSASSRRITVYYKYAASSSEATPTFTMSASPAECAAVIVGCNGASDSIADAIIDIGTTTGSGAFTVPAITVGRNNTFRFAAYSGASASAGYGSGTMTLLVSRSSNDIPRLGVLAEEFTSLGSTGTSSHSNANFDTGTWVVFGVQVPNPRKASRYAGAF